MTHHEITRASEHHPDRGADHATSATPEHTPLPRRRDIHHPTPSRPRRHSRRGLPVALTVMALSTGMATGVAAAATGGQTPEATSVGPTTATTVRTGTLGATSTGASTEAVADAQAALARAKVVAADSLAVTRKERKRITRLAGQVRELVAGSPSGTRTQHAASRSTEREPLDQRADDRGAKPEPDAASEKPRDTAGSGAASAPDGAGDTSGAGTEPGTTIDTTPLALPAEADLTTEVVDVVPETLEAPVMAPVPADGAGPRAGSTPDRADGASSRTGAGRTELTAATRDLTAVLNKAQGTDTGIEPAPATPAEILAAQVRAARDAASMLARHADDTAGYENGRIPGGDLCELSFAPGESLRCDAAEQLERLDTAFRARFGAHLDIRDSYRSYDSQVAVKAAKGYLAAVPGYSNHGWGVAVDLSGGVQSFGSAQYAWLRENAPAFGWDNPGWARSDGRKPEAWHWEYTPLR
ncbi:D-alanyl-D-alanine carboxypeptidase family protein [Isoptericola sp. BMS4]|uniref:D-alanyl-D-alanine carboxypeptidase family protein n=1 Tax=Isoptericola sp. BMS4 TaxID=2527875 RepID=UPI00196B01BA|nr:D-alanyl-D-alanine carboxypeptidase family protein [Isoptericola sp. BMS4]